MYGLNCRQWTLVVVLAFMMVFTFAAVDENKIGWIFGSSMAAFLLIIDFMFLNEKAFWLEPSYHTWERVTQDNPLD